MLRADRDGRRSMKIRWLAALGLLGLASTLVASPEPVVGPKALQIEGMEPMTPADLARFTAMAVQLAQSSHGDPRVTPVLEAALSQSDRGIIKRSIAYLALS